MTQDKKNPLAAPAFPEDKQWSSPFGELLDTGTPDGPATPQNAHSIIGTPLSDGAFFPGQQSYADTCAIRCQEFILEQFTGNDIPELQLVQECAANGWYMPGQGTAPEDVGNLLELHGIPVNRYQQATVFHLAQELGQGHKVIVSVDSGELWGDNPVFEGINDYFHLDQADHAVVVSGIDTTDPQNPHVIVSDPGTGEAIGRYPMAEFIEAWRDSDFYMVSTQTPAPSHLPEMVNFDYAAGHIPEVVDMPWEEFTAFEEQPQQWEEVFESELYPAWAEQEEHAVPAPCVEEPPAVYQDEDKDGLPEFTDYGAEQAALDAEFEQHLDDIDREAFRHQLDSSLDPDTFTNKYDD